MYRHTLTICGAVAVFFLAGVSLFAAPTFSGVLDSKLSGQWYDREDGNEYKSFTYTLEEYLNLRLQARIGEAASFYGAFNIIAAAGAGAFNLIATPGSGAFTPGLNAGENFVSAIELERLYLRFSGETAGLDVGLFRQAFGYGSVWAPTDFLNPRNPLVPDARPRAVLGLAGSWYPVDGSKFLLFTAAPRAISATPDGVLAGISGEAHTEKVSVQGLYAYELPRDAPLGTGVSYDQGIHRFGLSCKADVEAGLYADALYTVNPEDTWGTACLSATAGADYSFAPREPKPFFLALIIMAEYLYNGEKSTTARNFGGVYANRHYLSGGLVYQATNYTSVTLSVLAGLEDGSVAPIVQFQQSISQGIDFSIDGQFFPFADGEFGHAAMGGCIASFGAKLKARF